MSQLISKTSALSDRLNGLMNVSQDMANDLRDIQSRVSALQTSIDSVSSDVSLLSQSLSTHGSQLSELSSSFSTLSTNMSNLQRDVTASALTISDLQRRVADLESSSGSSLTFLAPLRANGNSVSLDMDPYFCSERSNLTSYSASAQLLQFQWYVRSEGGSSDSIDMSVVAHCHGRRTDYLMSTHDSLTVTGNSVSLVFNLDYITTSGVEYARLIPSHGFQQATFPVDISFTKNDTTHTYQVYGAFDGPRVFKVTFSPGETSTTNVRFLTVRTGIDT